MAELKSITYLPSVNSSDQDWIAWYKDLLSDTGKINASQIFMKGWEQRKNESAIFGSSANTSALRDFLKTQGVTLSGDGVFGFAYDALDTIDDWGSSIFNMGKWTFIVIGVVIIVPIFVLMISIARDPKGVAGSIKLV